jgi:phosphopantetheinyl transferase
VPGQILAAECTLSLEEDLFLHDHTLGRAISRLDPTLLALPIVPLTVSMEILAEAAVYLFPKLVLVGMRDVRAYRWILLEKLSIRLELDAQCKRIAPEGVEVEVTLLAAGKSGDDVTPVLVGTMLLAPTWPAPPAVSPVVLQDERPSHWKPGQIYTQGMFHGPSFQAIMAVDRIAADGSVATMQALTSDDFFRSCQTPAFVAEPVLLDAAGQLIGLWTLETLESAFVVFPYHLETLAFYGPPFLAGELVTCQAQSRLQEGGRIMSDIDLVDQQGILRVRLTGWEDKRFHIPRQLYQFILNPSQHPLSETWARPLAGYPQAEGYCCQRVGEWGSWGSHFDFWEKIMAYCVLGPRERELWAAFSGPERRRRDWLLGRVAAKEAVIHLLRDLYSLELAPVDVEITADAEGRPYVQGEWLAHIKQSINVSIAHSDGMVVAMAGLGVPAAPLGIGIDLEPVESDAENFADIAFTPEERKLLEPLDETDCWALRLWCGKEAVGKALGRGLSCGLHSIVATQIDSTQGVVQMRIEGTLAERFPLLAGSQIRAFTAQDSGWIVASVLDSLSL